MLRVVATVEEVTKPRPMDLKTRSLAVLNVLLFGWMSEEDRETAADAVTDFGRFLATILPTGDPVAVDARRAAYDRGQGNLVGLIIGVTVAGIVGIGVAIPIINDVISDGNLSGTTALIAGFIPVMVALMVFVATAAPIMKVR